MQGYHSGASLTGCGPARRAMPPRIEGHCFQRVVLAGESGGTEVPLVKKGGGDSLSNARISPALQ